MAASYITANGGKVGPLRNYQFRFAEVAHLFTKLYLSWNTVAKGHNTFEVTKSYIYVLVPLYLNKTLAYGIISLKYDNVTLERSQALTKSN